MNTKPLHEHHSPLERARLFDAAKARAVALRGEAIDAFWSSCAHGAARWIRRATRASATHLSPQTRPCPR